MANMERTPATFGFGTRRGASRLLAAGGLAMALSVLVNLAIYSIANAILSDPIVNPNGGGEMPIAPVIGSTIVAIAVATAIFGLVVRRFHRSASTFVAIAVVVLLPSLLPVFATPDVPVTSRLVLGLMHVATAAITVSVLTARGTDS